MRIRTFFPALTIQAPRFSTLEHCVLHNQTLVWIRGTIQQRTELCQLFSVPTSSMVCLINDGGAV